MLSASAFGSADSSCFDLDSKEVSFEWSHRRISFTDSKVRATLQNSFIHSAGESIRVKTKRYICFMMISLTTKVSTSAHKITTFNMFNTIDNHRKNICKVADDTKLSRLEKGASYHFRLS